MAFSAGIDLTKCRGTRETNYIWRAGRWSRGRREEAAAWRSGLFASELASINIPQTDVLQRLNALDQFS